MHNSHSLTTFGYACKGYVVVVCDYKFNNVVVVRDYKFNKSGE